MTVAPIASVDIHNPEEPLFVAAQLGVLPGVDTRVDVLEHGEKSTVYRLSWQAPQAGSFVVKRYRGADGRNERDFYTRLAPRLSVRWCSSATRCTRTTTDGYGSSSRMPVTRGRRSSRRSLGRSSLNGLRPCTWAGPPWRPPASRMPDRFAQRLEDARSQIVRRLDTEALDDERRDVIERCLERCRQLSAGWPVIQRVCWRFPRRSCTEISSRRISASGPPREARSSSRSTGRRRDGVYPPSTSSASIPSCTGRERTVGWVARVPSSRSSCWSVASSVCSCTVGPTPLTETDISSDLKPADGRFGCGPSKVRPEALAALAERDVMGTSHRQRRSRTSSAASATASPSCSRSPTATRSCSATAARPRSGTPRPPGWSASARCT